jgi:protein TonB
MSYPLRIALFLVASALGHLLLARAMARLPERPRPSRPVVVQVQLREPPPPEPPKPPPREPEARRQPVHEAPSRRSAVPPTTVARAIMPRDVPPTERPAPNGMGTAEPVFGVSMESTSQGGDGPVVRVGNTLQVKPKGPAKTPAKVKPLAPPVAAFEVTKMPLPQGRCSGQYTEAARQAALEGTVVLDLVVGPDGTARDITVVQGLGHGLTEAAVAALRRCRFTPGERNGERVPVRVRGFKIRFFLQGGD